MLKYKVGTRLRHKFAPTATYIVADFRMANPMQYLLSGLSEYHTPTWVSENDIPDFMDVIDETSDLQAENERLKAIAAQVQDLLEGALEDYSDSVPEEADYESGQVNAYQRVLALFNEGETK